VIFLADAFTTLHVFPFHESAARTMAEEHPEYNYFFADLCVPENSKPVCYLGVNPCAVTDGCHNKECLRLGEERYEANCVSNNKGT